MTLLVRAVVEGERKGRGRKAAFIAELGELRGQAVVEACPVRLWGKEERVGVVGWFYETRRWRKGQCLGNRVSFCGRA